jgi:hypothetical protein
MNILLLPAVLGSGTSVMADTWQALAHFWHPLQSSILTCGTSVEETIAFGYPCLLMPSRIPPVVNERLAARDRRPCCRFLLAARKRGQVDIRLTESTDHRRFVLVAPRPKHLDKRTHLVTPIPVPERIHRHPVRTREVVVEHRGCDQFRLLHVLIALPW